jgi:protein-tyrosine phosphatase
VIGIAIGSACAGPPLLYERSPSDLPIVERIDAGSVRIEWPDDFSNESVAIFGGLDPDAIDRAWPLTVSEGPSVKVTDDDSESVRKHTRLYYELVPTSTGQPVVVTERRLPLACCDNFRDLGGYRTADGRIVRWNRLYRSDDLSDLGASDLRYLSQLNIKLVCDFRSDRERTSKPDETIDPAAQSLSLPVTTEGVDPEEMQRRIRTGGMVALGVEQTMKNAYRSFVTDYTHEWSRMFERLAVGVNLPTVVHCTAGKDRTGFASALVLLALGVPMDTVFDDYLLTNYYQQNFFRLVLRWVPLYSLFRTAPEDLLPLLTARRAYLQSSIDAIVEGYGSVDAYLEQALGLTPAKRAQLAALFLK